MITAGAHDALFCCFVRSKWRHRRSDRPRAAQHSTTIRCLQCDSGKSGLLFRAATSGNRQLGELASEESAALGTASIPCPPFVRSRIRPFPPASRCNDLKKRSWQCPSWRHPFLDHQDFNSHSHHCRSPRTHPKSRKIGPGKYSRRRHS